jgi:thiol-disulfide isomerase/thioredoxin
MIYGCSPPKPAKAASLKPDSERHAAPDFALKDADGKTVRLSDYKGKVVLLDFWATYCGPCKIEIPWFMDFERKHKDQGFSVLGVSMDDDGLGRRQAFRQRSGHQLPRHGGQRLHRRQVRRHRGSPDYVS